MQAPGADSVVGSPGIVLLPVELLGVGPRVVVEVEYPMLEHSDAFQYWEQIGLYVIACWSQT